MGGCDTSELSLGEACADVRRVDPDGRVQRAWAATGGTVCIIDFDGPDLSGGCDVALELAFDGEVSVYVGFKTPDPAWYDDDGAVCTTQLP